MFFRPMFMVAACAVSALWSGDARAQMTQGAAQCTQYLMRQGAFYGDRNNLLWREDNALWLCDGATTPQNANAGLPAPVRCFNQNLRNYSGWAETVGACRLQRGLPVSTALEVQARLKAEVAAISQSQAQRQQQLQGGEPFQRPQAQPPSTSVTPPLIAAPPRDLSRIPVGGPCVVLPDLRPISCLGQTAQEAARQRQVTIAFTNQTTRPVDQHLLAPDGQRQFYYTLQAGETVDQISNPGVSWVFTADGSPAGTYETRLGDRQQYAIRSSGNRRNTPQTSAPPVAPAARTVDGTRARMFDFGRTSLVKVAGNHWVEVDNRTGRVSYAFEQRHVSHNEVHLLDPARQMKMRINLPERAVYIGFDIDAVESQQVSNLAAVSSDSQIPGSSIEWDKVVAPRALLTPPAAPPASPAQQTSPALRPVPPVTLVAQPVAVPTQPAPATEPKPAGPGQNDPSRALEAGQYASANLRCAAHKAQLGPGQGVMTQTLGACSPLRTVSDEFVTSFRSEELVSTTRFTSRGVPEARQPKVVVASNPIFQAWIDASGILYVAMKTEPNSISINNISDTKTKRGPFLRTVNVTVTAGPGEIEVQTTFPLNGMGSSLVSRSTGINVSASITANAGPQNSGVSAGLTAGWSDTTTSSQQMEDFKIAVSRSGSTRTFEWRLCGWAPMTGCYTGGGSLIAKGFLGAWLEELIPLAPAATRIDGFKNDMVYKISNRNTVRALLNRPFSINVVYDAYLNVVSAKTSSDGLKTLAPTVNVPFKRTFQYYLDLSELARIIEANPTRYGGG
ncbi:MAG: hypothetical protein ACRC7G_02955 [Beijerinckiaceae bacterium]